MQLIKKSFTFLLIISFMTLIIIPNKPSANEEIIKDPLTKSFNIEKSLNLNESIMIEGELSPPENDIESYVIMPNWHSVTVLSSPTKQKRFVRYLTGSWAKANSYIWTKSLSASSTISNELGLSASSISNKIGVSNTVTTSYSVGITIPASSSRFSKLGFYSGYNSRYVKVDKKVLGVTASTKYGYHYAPTKDTYLQVVYQ